MMSRLVVAKSARHLANSFDAPVPLMQAMARIRGRDHVSKFNLGDLTTWVREMAALSRVAYSGVGRPGANTTKALSFHPIPPAEH